MKEHLREMYDEWLAEGKQELAANGNMRPLSRQQMVEWVLATWKKVPVEIIQKSFKVCALSCNLDGSEDEQLMCVKHESCQCLLPRLQAAVNLEESEEVDPFEINVPGEDMAQEEVPHLVIGEDDDVLDIEI